MSTEPRFAQVIEVRGHIIDSMILPRILDELMDLGVEFNIEKVEVGRQKRDTSYARLEIVASSQDLLDRAVDGAQRLGALPLDLDEVTLEVTAAAGVAPEEFYSTTNLETWIRRNGRWIAVEFPEMDCAVVVEGDRAFCLPINELSIGQEVVVGHHGLRIVPLERSRLPLPGFGFMGSAVSSERPSGRAIREAALWMRQSREAGLRNLLVAGPAVIHTAARDYLCQLIARGYVDVLFAGNALATHDIEYSFFGTSLGIPLDGGKAPETGHEHHLRAINRIRALGGISQAVAAGILTTGVMYNCVKYGVEVVLAGSIRDDGPLPDVITDVVEAQRQMRAQVHKGVHVALMLSTMLHSIAVGNLLPAACYTVCVDINPSTLTKLVDRGSFQTLGIVMDVGGFLRDLLAEIEQLDASESPAAQVVEA
ncbi:MAG TPA: TIGR00300 family protein [Chloroflexota bacterium]|nr:TIGR00300 family protein [Chloroflexota bacterium]